MINNRYLDKILDLLPAPNAVLLADSPKFTFLRVNEGYMKITGRKREQLVGKGYFEVFPENLSSGFLALQNVINDKVNFNSPITRYEITMPETGTVEVKYLDILNMPVLNDANEVKYIIRSVTDVTEIITTQLNEEIANTSLINREKLLNETERIARSGSWEVDLKNDTILWSVGLSKIFEVGGNFKPTLESAMNFFKPGADREKMAMVVEDAIEQGSYFDVELKIVTAKGNERWVRSSGEAEMVNGKCLRIYGTIQDITERKITEQALIQSRNQFQSLIQTVDGIVWEADAQTFDFTFISDQVKNILGYTPEEWLSEPRFWENHIHPDDRAIALNYCQVQTRELRNHTFDYRMFKADGSIIWIKDAVSVISEDRVPKWLRGLMLDITETRRFADVDRLEKRVLELNAQKDVPIQKVLSVYIEGIETLFPHLHCSIHKVKSNRLQNWASPSLPTTYTEALENLPIGNNTGSCGTAAFLKEKVIVSNIATDPRWVDYKHLALMHNLQACWSVPIIDKEGKVMAVFGIYYHVEKLPQEDELKTVDRCAAILKVILENRQNSDIIHENSLLMLQGQELANFGNWRWDIQEDVVRWSGTLYNIYGLDDTSFKATFEGYQELLHPDDREMVYQHIQNVLQTKKDVVFEERIIRPGGEIRYLKSWGRLNTDEHGVPVEMIGACLDITESN
jgi:PAS domain S-box-containing protein